MFLLCFCIPAQNLSHSSTFGCSLTASSVVLLFFASTFPIQTSLAHFNPLTFLHVSCSHFPFSLRISPLYCRLVGLIHKRRTSWQHFACSLHSIVFCGLTFYLSATLNTALCPMSHSCVRLLLHAPASVLCFSFLALRSDWRF